VRDRDAAFRVAQGLPTDPQYREYFRYLYLQHVPERVAPLPASIADRSRLIRPVFPAAEGAPLPAWLDHLADLPTVYVTLGTVHNQTTGLLERLVAALGRGEYNLLVTVGEERDPDEFGPQPPTVHIERYVPQGAILPRCDAVVGHGGSGTLIGALAHGLPTLITPLDADHFWSAKRLAALGAATILHVPEVNGESVRAALHRVLSTPGYGERAAEIQAAFAAMPPPIEVARVLEARLPTRSGQVS
jgi:MGT family glycosyltransferase